MSQTTLNNFYSPKKIFCNKSEINLVLYLKILSQKEKEKKKQEKMKNIVVIFTVLIKNLHCSTHIFLKYKKNMDVNIDICLKRYVLSVKNNLYFRYRTF